jgi:hypothetical protein
MSSNLRLLVAIASFGDKNLAMLKTLIQSYRSMAMAVDVLVTSNAPKEQLGSDIEVVVGLPSENPWSLPFAHKRLFAERVDSYDLFIYSEDDMAVTESNIQAFIQVTKELASDELAGYIRYEVSPSGDRSIPDAHGPYHWKPESVRRRGPYTIAEFTNEHAGFYILTQAQLRRAIASGGFLRAPCEGRYGMLETAATDPYTNCGFRKVVCISTLEDFLIHHLSNRYVGKLGVSLPAFEHQVLTLMQIGNGIHPASTLCEVESKMPNGEWSKSYYENTCNRLLEMIPRDAKSLLSIGCGWGATEEQLKRRGTLVTALPLDSVIGAEASSRGIEVIYGSWQECFRQLDGRTFDCLLIANLLHLQRDLSGLFGQLSRFIERCGTLVIAGPNFHSIPIFLKRVLRREKYGRMDDFSNSGIETCGADEIATQIRKIGLSVRMLSWHDHQGPTFMSRIAPRFGGLLARGWILRAEHPSEKLVSC